jgi:hypothetical protein
MKKETQHDVPLRIVGPFASKIDQYDENFVQLIVYVIFNVKGARGNFTSALR